MTVRRAFDRRDFFTCSECFYMRQDDEGRPTCRLYGDTIRWNAHGFGCGDFGLADDRVEKPSLFMWGGSA